ncbi:MAG: anti-sigma factor antagonist [Firmicutes bacterium]|nr:anti-sigma factor antagonist [Bacillota bacterium]
MVTKINDSTIKISGRIDSNNAKQFEDELLAAAKTKDVTLDAAELEYISSAGLRVLLKLKKSTKGNVLVINVSPDVYDIFGVTGFDNILDVKKALREIDVTGCNIIGQGGNGIVYRIDDDKIVKVYKTSVGFSEIEQEREFAKNALINGIPCVIAYDVVKCGESYGIVFEMLKSDTLGHAIKNYPDKFDEYIEKYVALAKELHGAKLAEEVFTSVKTILHDRVPKLAKWCSEEEMQLLDSLIDEMPDEGSLIHGDLHPGNIMIQDGELVLIDMPEVTIGAKIWDLASIYRDLISGPQNARPDAMVTVERSLGMPKETAIKAGMEFFKLYTGITDDKQLEAYLGGIGLVYALNVVLLVGSGTPDALNVADSIMDKLLRNVIIPNEQSLRYLLKSQ